MMHDTFKPAIAPGRARSAALPVFANALLARLRGALRYLVSGLAERARQRRALSRLDDRLLRDIGVTRADAAREARRLF